MTTATSERSTDVAAIPAWRPFKVKVAHTQRLSPTFLRITFTGDDLDEFGLDGPDQRIKLYIPRAGHSLPTIVTDDWYNEYRDIDPQVRGYIRTYTIRARRREAREIDVDFALHGDAGPASAWAATATAGQHIVLIGPNDRYDADCQGHEWNPPVSVRDILIAGDESATPAIVSILESMHGEIAPEVRVQVLIEVPESADALDVTAPEQAEITWLPRQRPDGSVAARGELLVEAVRATQFGTGARAAADSSMVDTVDIDLEILWEVAAAARSNVYAWVAGEAGTVKTIRRHLVNDLGIDRRAVTFMGYWRAGRSED